MCSVISGRGKPVQPFGGQRNSLMFFSKREQAGHLDLTQKTVSLLVSKAGLFFLLAVGATSTYGQQTAKVHDASIAAKRRAFLENHCADCHNDTDKTGGFTTSAFNAAHPERTPELAEKILGKLHSGMMPPAPEPRPDAAELEPFLKGVETSIDRAATAHPYVGYVALHRLNRLEYANAIHSLLRLDVNVNSLLPADDLSHGFNNIAEALTTSPALLKAYVDAAGKISRLAIGDPNATATETTYRVPRVVSQTRHIDGTPFGTRGGIAVVHNFPVDGDYIFKLAFYTHQQGYLFGQNQGKGQQVEIAVNGVRVVLFDIDPKWKVGQDLKTPPIYVKAGPQSISAAFIKQFDGPVQDEVQAYDQSLIDVNVANLPGLTTLPHLYDLAIVGPTKVGIVSETPSRRRVFVCQPTRGSQEDACARAIVENLVRVAYRRPASRANVELALKFYRDRREQGKDFDEGIRVALQSILANPQFIFRFEHQPNIAGQGQPQRIDDLELASRLSFFLWSAPPDDELLRVAATGTLHTNAVLQKQVRRMLADQRSNALATNFAVQWLNLKNLNEVLPDPYLFPNFDHNLAQSMLRETELFFGSVVREDHNVLDLLNADYTFVDERLAKHYGIPNVIGNRFRRVEIRDDNRRGLLGQASILTLTSTANRTSPVTRGKWVLQVLFGAPPPPPPPNIPALIEAGDDASVHTVRQRLEEHRKNPSCASCHYRIDPEGFALENFDATGAWRASDNGLPIDSTSTMFDGTLLDSPASLRRAVLSHSDTFLQTFTENLLAYGLGRVPDYRDRPLIRSIVAHAARHDYRFSDFVDGIVESPAFQDRGLPPTSAVKQQIAASEKRNAVHENLNNKAVELRTDNLLPSTLF
jgi:mono/diheme cytochrome c family protein